MSESGPCAPLHSNRQRLLRHPAGISRVNWLVISCTNPASLDIIARVAMMEPLNKGLEFKPPPL